MSISNPGQTRNQPQGIAIPKGGGSITSFGEAFHTDEFRGAASLTIPMATADARGFGPNLALTYTSSSGNGPFGLGFSLSLPSISRKTVNGIPKYEETDGLVFSGLGELVRVEKSERAISVQDKSYRVTSYWPRLQNSFDLIEHWVATSGEDDLWRVVDRENVTSIYGRTAASRISDPLHPEHIFAWLLEQSFDAKGNIYRVDYLAENRDNVPDDIWEVGRGQTANKYVGRVRFGNETPFQPSAFGIGPPPESGWHFETLFDYGQYDVSPANPNPCTPVREWAARPDPFSIYDAGFEVRTHRLCYNMLLSHRFTQLGSEPVLSHVVRLSYDKNPVASRVVRMDSVGYSFDRSQSPENRYKIQALPPLEFGYVPFEPETQAFQPVFEGGKQSTHGIRQPYTLVDINGEGASGILFADETATWYAQPELTRDARVRFGSLIPLPEFPAQHPLGSATQLIDVDGNGQLDLMTLAPGRQGYYPKTGPNSWGAFRAFQSWPTDYTPPGSEFVDLTGDGRPDLAQTTFQNVCYYPSLAGHGYAPLASRVNRAGVPASSPTFLNELYTFADILGAGTPQMVHIADGIVECWPSLGYGAFAERVTLGNAPRFGPDFDVSRLKLADIDGTGAADIAYVTGDGIRVWINQSGNSFAAPVTVYPPAPAPDPTQVGFADLGGTGTTAVTFSELAPETRVWSYDFSGGRKPYLMESIVNNLGAETRIEYSTSAICCLQDKKQGRPWVTSIPFPVPVVSALENHDSISETRTRISFSYHDGYYDPVEREFRGFGMVERLDAQRNLAPAMKAVTREMVEQQAGQTAPLLTKTWYYTGAYIENGPLLAQYAREYFHGDPEALQLPFSVFDWGPANSDFGTVERQGYASLAGRPMRVETYGLSGEPSELLPYKVSQTNATVRLLQPPCAGRPGVYLVRERESCEIDYERVADDPTTTQECTLRLDDFGNVALAAAIMYPRRPHADSFPQQKILRMTCTQQSFINQIADGVHILGLSCATKRHEILGMAAPAGRYYTFQEVETQVRSALAGTGPAAASLYNWSRDLYYGADGGAAPPCQTGPQQLLMRQESIFARGADLERLFDGVLAPPQLSELLQDRGHYHYDTASGYWWQPGLTSTYRGASGFYLEASVIDPYGATVSYRWDADSIYVAETVQSGPDLQQQTVRVDVFDYLKLQPLKITDLNDNVNEVQLDPLGKVLVSSHYGHQGERALGFQPVLNVAWPQAANMTEVVNNPDRFLRGAETYYYYDLFSWMGRVLPQELSALPVDSGRLWAELSSAGWISLEGAVLSRFRRLKAVTEFELPAEFLPVRESTYAVLAASMHGVPAGWVMLAAQNYPPLGAEAPSEPPQIHIDYTDGYGRRSQSKIKAEAGPAFSTDARGRIVLSQGPPQPAETAERWITTGRIRYNNKGLPFKQHEPYFTDTWLYTNDSGLESTAAAVVTTYDALNRPLRIDLPAGYFTRYARTAWKEVEFDPCDSVLESIYYCEHFREGAPVGLDKYAGEALMKTMLCANTPHTFVFDNRGNTIAVVKENNPLLSPESFTALGMSVEQSSALFFFLQNTGFLDFRGSLTIMFQPALPGFSLNLPPEFQPYQAQIMALLESMQNTGLPEVSQFGYDVQGGQIWAVDPRLAASWPAGGEGAKNFERFYALNGSLLKVNSADAGTRHQLSDFAARTFFQQDGNGLVLLRTLDAAGRPVATQVSGAAPPLTAFTAERWIYGDALVGGQPVIPDAKLYNLMGRTYRSFDQSGFFETDLYALTGGIMSMRRQITKEYETPINWQPGDLTPDSPLLDPTVYRSSVVYDSLARVRSQTDPAGYIHQLSYLLSGKPGSLSLTSPGGSQERLAGPTTYDAWGRLASIAYGNGVVTDYRYDPLSFHLAQIRSSGPNNAKLQDLFAWRDAMGNLTHLSDAAFTDLFGPQNNSTPQADYDYDALYRVVSCSSQECKQRGPERDRQGGYEGLEIPYSAGAIDPNALVSYDRCFAYDTADNLYAVLHQSPGSNWSRQLVVSEASNRAIEDSIKPIDRAVPELPPERTAPASEIDAFFDGNGNAIRMPGIDSVRWNYQNQIAAAIVDQAGAGIRDYYVYDGAGGRVRMVEQTASETRDSVDFGILRIERTARPNQPWEVTGQRVRSSIDTLLVAELHLAADQERQLVYSLPDQLRSVAFQLAGDAGVLSYEDYIPYGPTSFAIVADPQALDKKQIRYSQEPRDRATGLYNYGARYFAPWSGRWVSPDPAGPVNGLNLYSFVDGDPTTAIDIGGTVKVTLADGSTVDIEPDEIMTAVHEASDELATQAQTNPLASTGTARSMPLYEPQVRGDLMRLSFQGRGDPIGTPVKDVVSFALKFGNIEATAQKSGQEPGAYAIVNVGTTYKLGGVKPGYAELQPTTSPSAEARRMIHLLKTKDTPSTTAFNNAMVPIMAIAETARAPVGGLLAMIELYNIKYGARTFDEAFDNGGDPYFIGAKTDGGAKALKHLSRVRRTVTFKPGQKMTRAQQTKLDESLGTYVSQLGSGRGKSKPSIFPRASNKASILTMVKDRLIRHAGPAKTAAAAKTAAYVQAGRTARAAKVAAARKMKDMK